VPLNNFKLVGFMIRYLYGLEYLGPPKPNPFKLDKKKRKKSYNVMLSWVAKTAPRQLAARAVLTACATISVLWPSEAARGSDAK
jgi:hypothetical protein